MAGHSHWAGIKHKKAIIDNKRGKLFSKLSKAIMVAARLGGPDPSMNLKLRYAIDDARAVSMPKDNIERAIKKGSGEAGGESFEELVYEGYGPANVAVIVESLTDNRNRTAGEMRKIFDVSGGKMGVSNSVAYMFERKGLIIVKADIVEEDRLMEVALEAGAEDMQASDDVFEITCEVSDFQAVTEALATAKIDTEVSQITQIPTSTVDVSAADAEKVIKLIDSLDDHEDVQKVYSNANLPDEALAAAE